MDIQRAVLEIIRGERQAPVLKAGLALLSLPYRLAVASRNLAYDWGVLPSKRLPVPVLSVGNIAAGGTGKTPLIHLLASTLQYKARLGILSRGYRSQIEKSGGVKQVSAGAGPLYSVEECGDEPYLLSRKTSASVWVGPDRILSGQSAIAGGVNCLLLDDGMQHRRLKRDFEIVVVDGTDPLCEGKFLPWGMLRDSPKRLKQASLIVATHVKDLAHFQQIQALISPFSNAPLAGAQLEVLGREIFIPRKVGLFCGIGQPAHFLQTVRDLKSQIVDTLILKDHGSLHRGQLEKFAENCRKMGAEALLCTEKDYVKLCGMLLSLEIIPVGIELKIAFGKEHWQHLIDNILDRVVV